MLRLPHVLIRLAQSGDTPYASIDEPLSIPTLVSEDGKRELRVRDETSHPTSDKFPSFSKKEKNIVQKT